MPHYYPLYLNVESRLCVVVGGGAVAERKVLALREAGARVRVVSPKLTVVLHTLAAGGEIETLLATYDPSCLTGAGLAFAATGDRAVNARVAAHAMERNIPVNVVDAPEEGSFIVPSVVRRGDLCLSISTGGRSPMLAARLCTELEARFGPEYSAYVELLGTLRAYIQSRTPETELRRRALARLLDSEAELLALLRAGDTRAAQATAEALLAQILTPSGDTER